MVRLAQYYKNLRLPQKLPLKTRVRQWFKRPRQWVKNIDCYG